MRIRLPKPISAPCVLITPMRASSPIVGSVAAMPTDMARADEVKWIYLRDRVRTCLPENENPGP